MNRIVIIISLAVSVLLIAVTKKTYKHAPVVSPPKQEIVLPEIKVEPIPEVKKEKPKPVEPVAPRFSADAEGLIKGGQKFPGARVCFSTPHPILMELASRHAQYMASTRTQGHQNFNARFQEAVGRLGDVYTAKEICAESWPWQANASMDVLGWEMFKCWRQSAGHWSVAGNQFKYFGAAMARGTSGIWYACIIVAN